MTRESNKRSKNAIKMLSSENTSPLKHPFDPRDSAGGVVILTKYDSRSGIKFYFTDREHETRPARRSIHTSLFLEDGFYLSCAPLSFFRYLATWRRVLASGDSCRAPRPMTPSVCRLERFAML